MASDPFFGPPKKTSSSDRRVYPGQSHVVLLPGFRRYHAGWARLPRPAAGTVSLVEPGYMRLPCGFTGVAIFCGLVAFLRRETTFLKQERG
jgi:hypothetical protein